MNRATLDGGGSGDKSIYWRGMEHTRWADLWLDPYNHTRPEYMLMDELMLDSMRNTSGLQREPPEPKPLSPSPNDWIVIGWEEHEDEVIILTGNLIIQAGGSLTLINCTLLMNCSYDGEWQILVNSSGTLNVLEGSSITAYNPEHEFSFYVYGCLVMRDSFLSRCEGLYLETIEGVELYNTTISNNDHGVVCYESFIVDITGCTISNNPCVGIECDMSSGISITDCTICDNGEGIFCDCSSDIRIENCTIDNNQYNVISVYYSSYVTIRDCSLVHNDYGVGIYCYESSDINIVNCTMNNNEGGIDCYWSSYVTIKNCSFVHNSIGMYCVWSSGISIMNCTIGDNWWRGIYCVYSSYVTIRDCSFVHNGVILRGSELTHFASHVIENSTINGKPIYYIVNTTSYIVPSDAGEVIIVNSSDITIRSINASWADAGVEIAYSSGISIMNCTIDNNLWGIYCYKSSNIGITGCTISNNYQGTYCVWSSGISIENCTISNNWRQGGIYCYWSSNINITGCTINSNQYEGIYCYWSSNITIHYCDIYSNQDHGLYNYGEYAVDATYCWWGSPDGPEYKREGDPDDPEEVYSCHGPEYLLYEPWLEESYRLFPWIDIDDDGVPNYIDIPEFSVVPLVTARTIELKIWPGIKICLLYTSPSPRDRG